VNDPPVYVPDKIWEKPNFQNSAWKKKFSRITKFHLKKAKQTKTLHYYCLESLDFEFPE